MKQVILVVGASKGTGLEIARVLKRQGHTVYGTSRQPERSPVHDVRLLALNVNDEASIEQAIGTIMEETGRLDVLVYNAGYDLYGAAEDTTLDELTAQMDTNFLGAVRVIQAVVPIMRRQKHGRIINISSIGGLVSVPFNSAYAASKFALEGYSEALRYELLPFNLFVSLVEPGQMRTDTLDTSIVSVSRSTTYAADTIAEQARARGRQASLTPAHVARKVAAVVTLSRPRLRYHVGNQVRMVVALSRWMPARWFESFVLRQFVTPLLRIERPGA